jgi:hypothetical protein
MSSIPFIAPMFKSVMMRLGLAPPCSNANAASPLAAVCVPNAAFLRIASMLMSIVAESSTSNIVFTVISL